MGDYKREDDAYDEWRNAVEREHDLYLFREPDYDEDDGWNLNEEHESSDEEGKPKPSKEDKAAMESLRRMFREKNKVEEHNTPEVDEATPVAPEVHEAPVAPEVHEATPVAPEVHEATPVAPEDEEVPKGQGRRPDSPLKFTEVTKDTYKFEEVGDNVKRALEEAKEYLKPDYVNPPERADCPLCDKKGLLAKGIPSNPKFNSSLVNHILNSHTAVFMTPVFCGCDGGGEEGKLGKLGRFAQDIPWGERGKFENWHNLRLHLKGQNKAGNIHNPDLVGFRALPPARPQGTAVRRRLLTINPDNDGSRFTLVTKDDTGISYELPAGTQRVNFRDDTQRRTIIEELKAETEQPDFTDCRKACPLCPPENKTEYQFRKPLPLCSLYKHISAHHSCVFETPVICGCDGGTDGANGKRGHFQTGERGQAYESWNLLRAHITNKVHDPARHAQNEQQDDD